MVLCNDSGVLKSAGVCDSPPVGVVMLGSTPPPHVVRFAVAPDRSVQAAGKPPGAFLEYGVSSLLPSSLSPGQRQPFD